MSKKAVQFGEIGGFTVSLAFAVFIQLDAQWLGEHPHIVTGLYFAATISATLYISQTEWFKRLLGETAPRIEIAPLAQSEGGNLATGDNSGRLLQALTIGTYNEAPHHQAVVPTPIPLPPDPIEFDAKCEWVNLVYKRHPGMWQRATQFDYANNPRKSLIVSFIRPAPTIGKLARNVSLVAIVRLIDTHSSTEQVPHAYWLANPYNEVWFGYSDEHAVVVGSVEGNLFASYENRYGDGSNNPFGPSEREVGTRRYLPSTGGIIVEVSLFDTHRKKVIEHRRFSLTFSPIHVCIELKGRV